MSEYLLGTSDHELARLALQHEVWGPITRAEIDRAPVEWGRRGLRVLDAGCGPGLCTEELAERVGDEGSVVAVDASPRWIAHVRERIALRGLRGVELVEARLEELALEPASVDFVLLRWVLGFVPEPGALLARLAAALRPGGALLVLDYNHEGISIFPPSEGFAAAVRGCRAAYAAHGGDPWIMGRARGLFRAAGLAPEAFRSHVISGGPGSPAHRWLDAFFPFHTAGWVAAGHMTAGERERFLADWDARARDPDAAFFSPIVVAASAVKP